jgi:hypothetical protein
MKKSLPVVGLHLATAVAQALQRGDVLADQHRDYCGVGLRYAEGCFIYGEVYDGQLPTESEAKSMDPAGTMERKIFPSRARFVAWLAQQTDESLSGKELGNAWLHDNQRLSLDRLRSFVGRAGRDER